jgi:outer membrane protein assembly factor BamB
MTKRITMPILQSFLTPLLLAGTLSAADDKPAWPQINGPFGNYNPRRYGCTLVDDLKQAKAVWTSEDNDLGYGKTSSGGGLGPRSSWPGHPGAANSLIAAEGKIFAASFRGVGEAYAEAFVARAVKGNYPPERVERVKKSALIEAEDIVVAMDQTTGKTIWKAVEPGGFNRAMGKRFGWFVSPVYHEGRVYSLSTMGQLFCYDAKDGKKLWTVDVEPMRGKFLAEKKACLDTKDLAAGGQWVSLIVADGVVIVPVMGTYKDGYDGSLRGVDAKTGKTLWDLRGMTSLGATPAVWTHQGRQYVLTATGGDHGKRLTGKLRLVDPKDGKVLWTVEGLSNTHFPLAPSEKHVLVNVGSKTDQETTKWPWMLLGCYELSLTGAKLKWTMPDTADYWHEPMYEASDWRKYLSREGKVYYYSGSTAGVTFSLLDEETGKLLCQTKPGGKVPMIQQSYLIEDRMLTIPNASHSNIEFHLWDVDPANFRLLSEWKPPHTGTTGYNIFMEFPYEDGRIFIRALDGTVRCYDLRKPTSQK